MSCACGASMDDSHVPCLRHNAIKFASKPRCSRHDVKSDQAAHRVKGQDRVRECLKPSMAVIDRLLWQIESHLREELSVSLLSARCAIDPHHMCRVFQMATRMSVMAYVRARRLSEAAKALAGQDADVLTVALQAGYSSHEAFTRAFAGCLGVLPGTVRKARSTANLPLMEPIPMNKEMIVAVADPELRDRPAFRVVGLSAQCSFEDTSAILALWKSFSAREGEVAGAKPGAAYGVCCDADGAGRFRYVAGVEASGKTEGMDFVEIPAHRYAVFTHRGHVSDLPKTVYTIWNKALPDRGLAPAKAPDFEVYDRRFDPETGRGVVEVWIPVV
jgi:AraC family transcriptional regulator